MHRRINNFEYRFVYGKKDKAFHYLIVLPILFLYCASVFAGEAPNLAKPKIVVPDKIAGVNTVSAEQVIEALSSDDPPLLIDARIKDDRESGFIESSVSLPDIDTNCDSLASIAADNKQHLLFYCNGVQCGRSVISVKIALSCGYNSLSWFRGGFAEWKEKGFQYITDK
ncbi:MAG: rhodanese-like domain-containing protein [Gammaproteobacteria bacterium]|nr:rhodanese-like domain-containing protein [Gammaproteobacteria bacterium]MBT8132955.1 rhodanese-like domain-containing protein [Gammaproteobacteria bacterium]NNJ51403.1 rhodanese-like domain-containing protein [Gammaproteobacteria bacterium]